MKFDRTKLMIAKWGAAAATALLPLVVGAQVNPAPVAGTLGGTTPQPISTANGLLTAMCTLLGWAFVILIILAVVFVIVAAFRYLTAGGDAEKVSAANKQLIYAAVAIVVAIIAQGVPYIIGSLFGNTVISGCGK